MDTPWTISEISGIGYCPAPESDASMEYLPRCQAIEASFTGTGPPILDVDGKCGTPLRATDIFNPQ
jgi:hypothetical protein